jgi:hypothetical protein
MTNNIDITTPLTFKLTFDPKFSLDWPAVRVYVNDQLVADQEINQINTCTFDATLSQLQNKIRVHYYNKSQNHTVTSINGKIESDQYLEVTKVHVNNILLGAWVLTEGYYCPDYFDGFIKQQPDAPAKLQSQLIWHFPGNFYFPDLPDNKMFWWWYRDQRRYIHVQAHNGKDDYRDETYIGSLESHQDLIDEIKQLINV